MRFGRHDRESYIGGYDPEHEMPDPDRDPRDRWQSDAYRHNAHDSRYMYRWAPDRYGADRGWRGRDPREESIRPHDRYAAPPPRCSECGRSMEGYDRPLPDRGYDDEWRVDRHRWDYGDDYGEPRDEEWYRWADRGQGRRY